MAQVQQILDPVLRLFYIYVKPFLKSIILKTNISITKKLLIKILT